MKIQGFFSGIKNANKAVEELKINGFQNSRVDLNEHYVINTKHLPRIAGEKNNPNLSSLILNTENFSADEVTSPMKAVSPMVSGMGKFEETADINYKVIVEVQETQADKVKKIIVNEGGSLKNYNINLAKGIK